jgi:hypothetical protein
MTAQAIERCAPRAAAETPSVAACSSDAEFLAYVDGLEVTARAMIEAAVAQTAAGNVLLESCRALRLLGRASAPTDIAGDLVPIASAAKMLGVTKAAVRKKAWRKGVCVRVGARLFIHQTAISALYG